MLDKNQTYAIIGATLNPAKYGHIVFKDLKDKGFNIIPINPKGGMLLGSKIYPQLSEVPQPIDYAVFIVPPLITEAVLKEVNDLKIKNAWFQPGSESEKAIEYCRKNNITYFQNTCIMKQDYE